MLAGCGSAALSAEPYAARAAPPRTASDAAPTASMLPQGDDQVTLNPADFTTDIDDPSWPMTPGTRWTYRETDEDGERQTVVVTVTDETRTVANGITARVVRDTVTQDGQLVEDTKDWYAQDSRGNIWYLGEDTAEFTDGEVSSGAGSFEAGVDRALPGIMIPADPRPGLRYRQEYDEGEAEDNGEVLSVDEMAEFPYGQFTDVLLTRDRSSLLDVSAADRRPRNQTRGVLYRPRREGGPTMALTVIHLLERNAAERGDAAACHDKTTGVWRSTSWSELNALTRRAGRAMIAMGVDVGDVVAVLGANRPEWTISALAAMRIGGVASGVYSTNSPSEIAHVVNHSASKLIVVDDEAQLAKVRSEWAAMPTLAHIVLLPGADVPDVDGVLGWDEFLARGDTVDDRELDDRLAELRPDQIADFIYTSGTTGPPKAVALTHDNLAWTAETLGAVVDLNGDDVHLSYLSLAHIAEQLASIYLWLDAAYTVHYCHDGMQVAEYLKEVEPTFFFGVPRVWERFRSAIMAQFDEVTGARAAILSWARGVGTRVTDLHNQGRQPRGALALQDRLADRLVFRKLRAATGLGRTRAFITGAAGTPPHILEFFGSLGICLLELYGQSEGTGPTSTNRPGATRFGTVGRPLDGVEVKLAEDDEILVRGRNVFAGYHDDAAATAETLIDGWLHSGDLGRFDADGYLSVIGRKKDIIITSGGKNIAPRNLEDALTGLDLVAHAVCVGEQQRYLVALITLDPDVAAQFAADEGIDPTSLHEDPALRARLEADIAEQVNARVARVEQIRNFVVLPTQFTVETGELTPSLKVKRAAVNERYADHIARAYADGQRL